MNRDRKYLTQDRALMLLRQPKHSLILMHSNQDELDTYYVVPGGPVTTKDAAEIISRPDVHPAKDGLFPGCDQSWRLGGDEQ